MEAVRAGDSLKHLIEIVDNSCSINCFALKADFLVKMDSQNFVRVSVASVKGYSQMHSVSFAFGEVVVY